MSLEQPKWDVIITNAENQLGYSILRSLARSGLKVGLGVPSHSGMLAIKNHMFASRQLPQLRDICPKVDGYYDAFFDDPLPLAAELVPFLKKAALTKGRALSRPTR